MDIIASIAGVALLIGVTFLIVATPFRRRRRESARPGYLDLRRWGGL
jgi:hypothetical protein